MLEVEAKWFEEILKELPADAISPMLNVGSSTREFRSRTQPFIEKLIFQPAQNCGVKVTHLDLKKDEGVDICGDLGDPAFLAEVQGMGFHSVFCSNLLEHVENRGEVAQVLLQILESGGYLILSCPYSFPYHPDPIDTRFRPTPEELAALFPTTTIVKSGVVTGGNFYDRLKGNPANLVKTVVWWALPFYKPEYRKGIAEYMPWFFRRFTASCVVLKKH